jgi:hypothetical protein
MMGIHEPYPKTVVRSSVPRYHVAFNEIFEMFADELRMAHDLSKSA